MPTPLRKFHIINEVEYNKRTIFFWRYFNLHKFYSFLRNREIRFTRMDEFEDPLEGVPLRALLTYNKEREEELIGDDSLSDLILDRKRFARLPQGMKKQVNNIKDIQQRSFVVCWFLGRRESMAMWNLYSNSDGVAVRIQASRLFRFFEENQASIISTDVSAFYAGAVRYQDFKKIGTEETSGTVPRAGLRKDESYSHEKEFRFVIQTQKRSDRKDSFVASIENLDKLNPQIVCHPLMPEWKRKNIEQMLIDAGLPSAFKVSEIKLRRK